MRVLEIAVCVMCLFASVARAESIWFAAIPRLRVGLV